MQPHIRIRLTSVTLAIALLWMAAPARVSPFLPAQVPPGNPEATPSERSEAKSKGTASGGDFIPGQLLVRFKPSVAAQRADQLLAQHGLSRAKHIKALTIDLLHVPANLSVEQAVDIFSRLPEVEFAEPNYLVQTAEVADPGLSNNQWAPQKMDAPQAWSSTEGDPSVVIAVVDTGIDYRHTELNPNIWTHGEILGNGVDDDGNGYVDDGYGWDFANNDGDPLDDHFHGTHVAGIAAAAASDNPAGVVGICPRCRLMAVKVLGADGSGSTDAVANGITYAADNGAKVINLSLGSSLGSSTLASAVTYAWNRGVVIVAAAGNDGADARLYPAAYPEAMAIAATNSNDDRACFSNFGDNYVSVAAPGELIYSTTPLDASGHDTYGTYSGTSMATPHAAGLAGLLFSQNPARTNAEVRTLIETTANDLGLLGTDAYFGAGRLNAYRAVQGDTSPTSPPAGLFSSSLTASGYANARKLARDSNGILHLAWHTQEGAQYRVLYAASGDGGVTWSAPQVVFESSAETYQPAMTIDSNYVYLAFPSKAGAVNYQVLFTRRALSGGSWAAPVVLMGGSYNAVRPDLYRDPSNGRLHLVASSFDDAPYVYYTASDDGGLTWGTVRQVNLTSAAGQSTRYADVHANGASVYLAGRTVEFTFFGLLPRYRLFTIRSLDNGNSWSDLTELATYDNSEAGLSLAGIGDQLYLGYEQGGTIYFRRSNAGVNWSNAESLGSGAWPSLAQEPDGQAWLMWENGGSLSLYHYNGTSWDRSDSVLAATGLNKAYYPNLNLGASGGFVEWTATHCSGAPYRLTYGSRALADVPLIPQLQFSATDYRVGEGDGAATVTVTLNGASAGPVTVKYATSDGTATAGSDYTAISGALTFNPGETSKTFSVTIREDTRDEPDETVVLTLSNPANAVLGSPANATITLGDNDPPPSVYFSISTSYVYENAGSATMTVRLSAASGYAVAVNYATSDGTATAGSDYTATSGTLTFNPGEAIKTFSMPITDDTLGEANETLNVSLSNPTNAALGSPATATLIIRANDTLTFSLSSYSVNENAGSATITVKLNAPSNVVVAVNYATSDGTAKAGSDYTATSGMLSFNPGEISKTFSVPITDDALGEANETLNVSLSNPTNATLGSPATATLTIRANDTVAFSLSSYSVNENAGSATITVKLSGPSSQVVTVNYATSDGTAKAGSDYTATSGTLAFNPGETSKTFSVPITDDALGEANETLTVSLTNPTNATLGSPSTATLTIKANDTVAFSLSNYNVNEGAGSATITVKLSGPSSQVVTVNYATSDSTAKAGSDYTTTNGTLTFNPGETSKTFTVSIINDTLKETSEKLTLTLSNPANAVLGTPASATLTIADND